jgi:1-phosphatidylinositol-3-phosphate 5-kinase
VLPTSTSPTASTTKPDQVSSIVAPHHDEQQSKLLEPMEDYMESNTADENNKSRLIAQETAAAAATKAQEQSQPKQQQVNAKQHLGLTAARHLEMLGHSLLRSDAPLLLQEYPHKFQLHDWLNSIMTLVTRCVATVNPNVKNNGDLMDVRPYVKLKVIPGGSMQDCAYLSGILFRKHVVHKKMAKEVLNPQIMLLSGGIEFTRMENKIASLDTLLEQEEKYIEILVTKILKLKPNVLLMEKSASRKAQELLLKNKVVLVQHVKSTLMNRIARQTGATIISSQDHVMNQFGANVLGKCRRFRLVTFRDNETWTDGNIIAIGRVSSSRALVVKSDDLDKQEPVVEQRRSIQAMLQDSSLKNHERQAVLAASRLGEGVLDGMEAVKCGLAKRGVAQTYVMLEGCPKHLGCTVVLRGASRAALKQVKRVFRFLLNVAYNLKLETSYLRERCVRLPCGYEETLANQYSSSLCVDYGNPPAGRKVRPWNGGNNDAAQRSISGNITALDHQSILITSVWMTDKTQCCPAEVKGIHYYSRQDVSLGQFLRDSCFNLSLKCQNPICKKSVLDHSLSFIHNDGLINITVEHMEGPLPPAPCEKNGSNEKGDNEDQDLDSPIATWTYCNNCGKVVTPLVYISDDTWKLSFGKFLEVFFYNRDAILNSPEHGCSCRMQNSTLYFGCGRLAARFAYEQVKPFGVYVRRNLPIDESFHRAEALNQLDIISSVSSDLFVRFDEHIEKVSREARSLLGSAANRPEHLQQVLSELNTIGSEVDRASKTLQEKIASFSDKCRNQDGSDKVANEAIFRFPWYSRRYLFMLTTSWNERLSVAGQAISAMKKLASSSGSNGQRSDGVTAVVPAIGGDASTEELMEGMRRLRQLNEMYSRYNVNDIGAVLPTFPGMDNQYYKDIEFDDDIDDPIDFSDGVDADVLASRRRLYNSKADVAPSRGDRRNEVTSPRKSLGTQRNTETLGSSDASSNKIRDVTSPSSSMQAQKSKTVTPGGAVKSAITRFFNRGGKEMDPYIVDLGIIKDGRPRLEPGEGGIVVPVVDEQPSTVIAYSLSSTEYGNQFKKLSRMEASSSSGEKIPPPDGSRNSEGTQKTTAGQLPSSSSSGSHRRGSKGSKSPDASTSTPDSDERKDIERRMLVRNKSHIKHTFRDFDEKGQQTCKFVCTTYWATQFAAVRQAFLAPSTKGKSSGVSGLSSDVEKYYVQSLSTAFSWDASGGKSGASFARTLDDRFVVKCISRTELQMFLDCAPAYFEYLSKAFFHGLPTVLCKIVGVYQIGYHNRETGKRTMEQVAVMQNIFYGRKISKTFDLKGSLKGRFARLLQSKDTIESASGGASTDGTNRQRKGRSAENETDSEWSGDEDLMSSDGNDEGEDVSGLGSRGPVFSSSATLLDGDFLEFTNGRPLPLTDRAKAVFHMSVLNDTLFLSIINVLDYSILVGIDEENMELVVGIIDFMRQYDILKQMERVGKSLPMVVGSEAPTIIQPPLYKARFTNAMERYFMTVPSKWTTI